MVFVWKLMTGLVVPVFAKQKPVAFFRGSVQEVGEVFYHNCMFWFQNLLLRWFHNRSVSFLRQETHEHVKTIKKRCLEANNDIFRKKNLWKRYVFPKAFPPCSDFWSTCAHFGSKTGFLMKFLNDSAWLCLEKLKEHVFQPESLPFNKRILNIPQKIKKKIQTQWKCKFS